MNSFFINKKLLGAGVLGFGFGLAVGIYFGSRLLSTVESPSTLYGSLGDLSVSASEVNGGIKNDLLQLEKNKYNLQKSSAIKLLLEKRNQKTQQLPENKTDDKISDQELKNFVKERNIIPSKLTKQQQTDLIRNFQIQKSIEKKKNVQENEGKEIVLKIPMQFLEPKIGIPPSSLATLGPDSASQKVDFFFNYHCPDCKTTNDKLNLLVARHKDKIQIRFHFNSREAEASAAFQTLVVATCANKQSQFIPIHQFLFDSQTLQPAEIMLALKAKNLNMNLFEECVKSEKILTQLRDELLIAKKFSLGQDTVLFVNGYRLQAQEPLDFIEEVLNQ